MKNLIIVVLLCSCVSAQGQKSFAAQFETKQLIVVTATGWNVNFGQLSFYELDNQNNWKPMMRNLPVTIGKEGMAWGPGLHPQNFNTGALKREGDGRSPAGIFKVTSLFSYGEMDSKMDHHQSDTNTYCVDDVNSAYYNQIVSTQEVEKDWNSAEDMKRNDDLYKFGAVVAYNAEGNKGAGSCIFLHIWREASKPTAGCTALAEANLLMLIQALNKTKNPILIQMPQSEYARIKKLYFLP